MAQTAREEISEFISSKEAGIKSVFSANTLTKAAESLFTSQGLNCPVRVLSAGGDVYLVNRDIVQEQHAVNGTANTAAA